MNPSVSKYCVHCTRQYFTARNVPISIQIQRPLKPSVLQCAHSTHQYANIAHIPLFRTALCAMNPSVSKYCAHCTRQYFTARNVPISIQIQRPLKPSVKQCAHITHQYANTESTPRLRTALCEMYP